MSKTINLTLPYPPSLNRLYRMVDGRFLTSKVGRDYKKEIETRILIQRVKKLSGAISISINAFRPQKRGDIDNTLKVLIDSMQGSCYENDNQITEIHAYRFEDSNNPRVEVEIKQL